MRRTALADIDAGDFGESVWCIGWPSEWSLEDVLAYRELAMSDYAARVTTIMDGTANLSTGDGAMQTEPTTATAFGVNPQTFDDFVRLIGATPGRTMTGVFRRVALAALLEHMTADEIADAFLVAKVSGATWYRLRAELLALQDEIGIAAVAARSGVAGRAAARRSAA